MGVARTPGARGKKKSKARLASATSTWSNEARDADMPDSHRPGASPPDPRLGNKVDRRTSDLGKSYGGRRCCATNLTSFEMPPQARSSESSARTAAGKTTLMKIISGLRGT